MPQPIENISSDLINLLKDRFEISDSVDEAGHFTDDPAEIKVFSFNFVNKKGEDKGSVVLSLLDDSESANSIKVYFGQDLGDSDTETKTQWYKFLQDLRQFAKMHLLGFDVRNINKSQITRRDVEKDLKIVKEDLEPMFEGTFGPIDGTVKTSNQRLQDSDIRIVIKHSDKIDPNVRYGRSRKIERIYLVNGKGERFLMPFPSLLFARAMARHIEAGGTPYDNVGGSMCQLMDELKVLSRFIKFVKGKIPAGDAKREQAIEAARQQYREVKKKLSRLTSKEGYKKFHSSVPVDQEIIDDELHEDIFNGIELDEESQLALPYVYRAYDKFRQSPEQDEFEKWVSAAKGQGPGQDVIMDGGVENDAKCPACYSKIVTSDGIGNYNCKDCRYKWNENDTEHGHDDSKEHPEDYYFNENVEDTPEQYIGDHCSQCEGEGCGYCDGTGYEPHNEEESAAQEEKGHEAADADLTFLRKEQEQMENFRPYEYSGMHKSVPTSDEIQGGGLSYLESISKLKKLVESADMPLTENKKPKCPHCGSKKYSLMPTDFETAKCKDCGKNWDHGIVKGINDPYEDRRNDSDNLIVENTNTKSQLSKTIDQAFKTGKTHIFRKSQPNPAKSIYGNFSNEDELATDWTIHHISDSRFPKKNIDESIPDREDNDLRNEWTACEEYGHRFDIDGEEFSSCVDCGQPRHEDRDEDPIVAHERSQIADIDLNDGYKTPYIESENSNKQTDIISESGMLKDKLKKFFTKSNTHNPAEEIQSMVKMLTNLDFELVAKQENHEVWQRSYYMVIFGINDNNKLTWLMARNGKSQDRGEGSTSFAISILMEPEFRGELKRLVDKNNAEPANETPVAESNKGIIDELMHESGLMEADIPVSAGWAGPLTWTNTSLGSKFHTSDEIKDHETTTGKLSPFSLLSSKEKDTDDAGNEVPKLAPRGVRSIMQSGGDSSGLNSMSQW
jgi:ribosomal protein L37AE/L43A